MAIIDLKTAIPGPKAQEMLKRRAAAAPAGLAKSTEVVVESAHGCVVKDVDGNTLLDFAGGIGMLAVGHTPDSVVAGMHAQAQKLIHACALVSTFEPFVKLSEVLNEITPGTHPKKTLLANSGAEAVENAVKIARYATGRAGVICFEGAYHGRTLLTLTLTSKYGLFKKGFGPFAPEVYRLPAPNPYRTQAGVTPEQQLELCIAALDNALIAHVDPSAIAAIIIEPVMGEAGFIPMPVPFLKKIRDICDQHKIVMIADEVQSGFGRTGKLFAIEHTGIVPDIMTMAKSLGAGMPVAAITGKAEIMDAPHIGGIGGTYAGNPVSCVAALEAIALMRAPGFMERVNAVAERMRGKLEALKAKHSLIGDVRGAGAMLLIELVKDHRTKEPAAAEALATIKACVARGLMLIRAGLYSNCIRFLPPLTITDAEMDEGFAVLDAALSEVGGAH